ncbi:MAG: succinate--CoA ligase subunit beta [Planctomycetia bacterium]|nr:succinate--CoA ligase subunit beta [Planctomycetia bacterium]
MEFEARTLFEEGGLPILKGMTVESTDQIEGDFHFPVVVKAQVMTGGRGKAGGVRLAADETELKKVASEILGMKIKQFTVQKVLIVEKADIQQEMYLSILLDRNTKKHRIVFSPQGGVDIEQTAQSNPELIFKMDIDPLLGYNSQDGIYLADKAGLTGDLKKEFAALVGKLYGVVKANDCLLAEINPLITTQDGHLIALDAKISVDDSGIFRHSRLVEYKDAHTVEPLVREAAQYRFLYIPCDPEGNVVIMSNGSGMLMSCIDHITRHGNKVSAVLDLGGGSTADRIEHGIRILFQTPGAKILFINIFGGITRCNEVALGIRNAIENQKIEKPIVVRFEGTNKDEGLKIIEGLPCVIWADGLIQGEEAVRRQLQ